MKHQQLCFTKPCALKKDVLKQQRALQVHTHLCYAGGILSHRVDQDRLHAFYQSNSEGGAFCFQAQSGEVVRFMCKLGQWRAEVLFRLGDYSRIKVLPVVCTEREDATSYIKALSKYPWWYSQRRIHVLARDVLPTLGDVVYLGPSGLKGGVEGASSGPEWTYDPMLVNKLRKLSDIKVQEISKQELRALGDVLQRMAEAKQTHGTSSGELSCFTDAAIFHQHVLSICDQKRSILGDQDAETLSAYSYRALAELEALMLSQILKREVEPSQERLRQRINDNKNTLKGIRKKAEESYLDLVQLRDKQGTSEDDVRGAEIEFAVKSKALFEYIATETKTLLAEFYREGQDVLGKAPCNYSVMGLGSLALQQTTPYSDVEFAILTEDANDEVTLDKWTQYLLDLTHLVHFHVINLGETVLPYSELEVSLDHLGKKGFNFDLGGKTPLGRAGKTYQLIQPVDKMAKYMRNEGGEMELMDKLLPYILESTCHIYGDSNLHKAYELLQEQFLGAQLASGKRIRQKRIAKKLLHGVKELGRGQPGDISSHRPNLGQIDVSELCNVKEEIYRLADRLLYGLAMYFGKRPRSGWDAVEWLKANGNISEVGARHLKFMVSFAVVLRLGTYIHHGQQSEKLFLSGRLQGASADSSAQAVQEFFHLPPDALKENGSLFRYYYTAVPLHRRMEEFFELLQLRQKLRYKPILDTFWEDVASGDLSPAKEGTYFKSVSFYDDSCAVKVSIYHRLRQYGKAEEHAQHCLNEVKNNYFYDWQKLARYYHNLAIACYHTGNFNYSFDHFKSSFELLESVCKDHHPAIAKVKRSQGIAYYALGKYAESKECFERSLAQLQACYEDDHPETARTLLNLGEVVAAAVADISRRQGRAKADGSQQHHGDVELEQSRKNKQQALDMLKSLHQDDNLENNPDIAQAMLSLAATYEAMDQVEKSLELKDKSLKMLEAAYGRSHPEVARAELSLGDTFVALDNQEKSVKYKENSLRKLRAYYGNSHPDIARALFGLGETYAHFNDLDKSIDFMEKSLDMFRELYRDHPEVAQAYDILYKTRKMRQDGAHLKQPASRIPPAIRTTYHTHLELISTPKKRKGNDLLRKSYQGDFPYVRPLFDHKTPKHVDNLECHLKLREQREVKDERQDCAEDQLISHHTSLSWDWVTIMPKELFKDRSVQPSQPVQPVKRIILTGDPGTGKTTLSRKLSYQWAVGTWGQEFNSVYLLPVRNVRIIDYDGREYDRKNTLATAIVNICFTRPGNPEEYQRLRQHVEEELQNDSTLVILDGLDERAGSSDQILSEAQKGAHRLLMLSRPYGIETERNIADIQIQHAGFNDQQLKNYVSGEVSNTRKAEKLLEYVQEHQSISIMAHVPVTLQILCALWDDESYGVDKDHLRQGSLSVLYQHCTQYIWKRYAKQCNVQQSEEDKIFDTLGQIALDALQSNEILIKPATVDKYAEHSKLKQKLQHAGFLLLQSVDEQFYQFPHLSFQEYFAGRWLAHLLLES